MASDLFYLLLISRNLENEILIIWMSLLNFGCGFSFFGCFSLYTLSFDGAWCSQINCYWCSSSNFYLAMRKNLDGIFYWFMAWRHTRPCACDILLVDSLTFFLKYSIFWTLSSFMIYEVFFTIQYPFYAVCIWLGTFYQLTKRWSLGESRLNNIYHIETIFSSEVSTWL